MVVVGLTGGIGSGKSTISKFFLAMGIPVFESDKEGRLVLEASEVIDQIASIFGRTILTSSGAIDRRKLASVVFDDAEKLEVLNQIVHPAVLDRFKCWLSYHQQGPYVVNESAILFESGFDKLVDYTINVYAPLDIRVKRVVARDAVCPEEVMARVKKQMSDEDRKKLSTWGVLNDGYTPVIPQMLKINDELLRL